MNTTQDTSELPRPSRKSTFRSLLYFVGVSLCALASVTAQVAGAMEREVIDATGSYRSEVRACQSGRSQQDRLTCMKEARSALADKRRGGMEGVSSDFKSNATARCAKFEGEDAAACRARVTGLGAVSGSVGGGGLLREAEVPLVPGSASKLDVEAIPTGPEASAAVK